MRVTVKTLLLSSALAVCALPAFAQSQGDWTFGVGVGRVDPKSDNGTLASSAATIDSDEALTLTFEYFIRDNIGIELLAATPFEHEISLGGSPAASTKHLPPTLSVNYHFTNASPWKPYVGAGINYTTFFEEEAPGLGTLELDDSFGLSVQVGLDYKISDNGWLRANIRWFDIDADATLNGADIGTAEIDPFLFGVAYVHKF